MKLLLADPARTWLRASALRLRRRGLQVETAADSRGVAEVLNRAGPFDGVLIDAALFAALPEQPGLELIGASASGVCWPILPAVPSASVAAWFACQRPVSSVALFRLVEFLAESSRLRLLALDVAAEVIATHRDAAAVMTTLARFADEFETLTMPQSPAQWERTRHRVEGACATLGAPVLAAHLGTLRHAGRVDARLTTLKADTLRALHAMIPIFFPPP